MLFTHIDLNYVKLNDCVYNENNSTYESKVQYNDGDGDTLVFSTGPMHLQSINEGVLEVSFVESNNDFYIFMHKLEKHIINRLSEQSEQLLGIQFKKENIQDLYKKFVLLPKTLYTNPKIVIECIDSTMTANLSSNCAINISMSIDKVVFEKNKCFVKCFVQGINMLTDQQDQYSDIINYIENI